MRNFAIASIVVAAVGSMANAQALVNTDWEAPTWNTGTIPGQNTWASSPAVVGHSVVSGTQTVGAVNVTPDSGSQMARLQTTAGSTYSWYDISGDLLARNAGNDWIYTSFRMFVPSGQTATNWFGATAWGTSNLAVGVRLRTDGTVIGTLATGSTGTGAGNYGLGSAPLDTWNTFSMSHNIVTGAVIISVNGSPRAAAWSVGGAANASGLTDVDLTATIQAGGAAGGVAFIDSFSVGAVPTPGAAALLGLGGLVAARRRRA